MSVQHLPYSSPKKETELVRLKLCDKSKQQIVGGYNKQQSLHSSLVAHQAGDYLQFP